MMPSRFVVTLAATAVVCLTALASSPAAQRRGGSQGGGIPGVGTSAMPQGGRPTRSEHAVAGTVTKVDAATLTMVVHTPERADQILSFAADTPVKGIDGLTQMSGPTLVTALEGASVVVRFTTTGFDATATHVDGTGSEPLSVVKGVIADVNADGMGLSIRTIEDETHAVVANASAFLDGPKGMHDMSASALRGIKTGTPVVAFVSREDGRLLLHLLKHN